MSDIVIVMGAEPDIHPVLDLPGQILVLTPTDIVERTAAAIEAGIPELAPDLCERLLLEDRRARSDRRAQALIGGAEMARSIAPALAKGCMPARPSGWQDANRAPRSFRRQRRS